MRIKHLLATAGAAALVAVGIAASPAHAGQNISSGAGPTWPAVVNSDNFVTGYGVTNPWFPLPKGGVWKYKVPGGKETVKVKGLRWILGVQTTVVHDTEKGEATNDFYAQDKQGNVWYFGERTSGHGGWLAGENGARPGVFMPANPKKGVTGAQEDRPGVAEDHFLSKGFGFKVKTPGAKSKNGLKMKEWSPIEPGVVEYKLYVKGVGPVVDDKNILQSFKH